MSNAKDDRQLAAAINIQSVARGHAARKQYASQLRGGLDYDEKAVGEFDLTADMQPCCGFDLCDAACMAACSTRRLGGATACHPSLGRTLEGLGCSTHSRPSDRTHRPVPRSLVLRLATSSGHIQAPPHPP